MKLAFVSEHKSIKNFESVDIDDFSILTGKNGSGKTQLLQSLDSGHATIDSFTPDEVVYFNFSTFKTTSNVFKTGQNRTEILRAAHANFKSQVQKFQTQYASLSDLELIKFEKILIDTTKPLLEINQDEVSDIAIWDKIMKYKECCNNIFNNNQMDSGSISILKKSQNFMHDISRKEFLSEYISLSSNNDLIVTELGVLFYDYQVTVFDERTELSNSAPKDTEIGEIEKKVQGKCNAKFGGVPPWEAINNILKSYSDMNHEIIAPAKIELATFNSNIKSFPVIIREKITDNVISPDDLSSGEIILFALALSVFKGHVSFKLPKVLLLDEIDATLHPSMIQNLLSVIDEVFLQKNVKVIMTTHSPTTIALCKEKSIYVVDRNNIPQLIQKQSADEALKKLTDGFVTIEEGLNLLKLITDKEITLITEGNNVDYIKKAIDLFGGNNKNKIGLIEDVALKNNSGETILKTVFDFFSQIDHPVKILFVFDPDCKKYQDKLHEQNNTYFHILSKNDNNSMTDGGIETLFDDGLFEENDLDITKNGINVKKKVMNNKRKIRFMKTVIQNASDDNFKEFKPLLNKINNILS